METSEAQRIAAVRYGSLQRLAIAPRRGSHRVISDGAAASPNMSAMDDAAACTNRIFLEGHHIQALGRRWRDKPPKYGLAVLLEAARPIGVRE
ncbi:MAG TPA: hypothetical protein VF516_15725 [Kofleriaceae bacterium]